MKKDYEKYQKLAKTKLRHKTYYEKYGEHLPEHIDYFINRKSLDERERLSKGRTFCTLRSCDELRHVINNRIMHLKYKRADIAHYLRVSPSNLAKYLDGYNRMALSQRTILLLAEYVGVFVNMQINIDPYYVVRNQKGVGLQDEE
tara:strand:- start:107 stop:541 length:435 start_codon:yes stop_codon:yes gene_type:complete